MKMKISSVLIFDNLQEAKIQGEENKRKGDYRRDHDYSVHETKTKQSSARPRHGQDEKQKIYQPPKNLEKVSLDQEPSSYCLSRIRWAGQAARLGGPRKPFWRKKDPIIFFLHFGVFRYNLIFVFFCLNFIKYIIILI